MLIIRAGYSLCPLLEGSQHAAPRSPGCPEHTRHIKQRDSNRSAFFYENSDYQHFLETLAEQAARYQCSLHAWCLMMNHIRLLLTPTAEESAALLMNLM